MPSERTVTSFGLFRYLPCQWKARVSRTPSRRSRTSELVTCSQTSRSRFSSSVMPLHLNDGLRTSVTAPSSVTLRRMSAGMSEK